jgi:hypothetical protein
MRGALAACYYFHRWPDPVFPGPKEHVDFRQRLKNIIGSFKRRMDSCQHPAVKQKLTSDCPISRDTLLIYHPMLRETSANPQIVGPKGNNGAGTDFSSGPFHRTRRNR